MTAYSEKVAWQSQDGKQIEVTVYVNTFHISVDGKWVGSTGIIQDPPEAHKVFFAKRGITIVGLLHTIALTQDSKDLLLETQSRIKAQPRQVDSLSEFFILESALIDARERVRAYNDRPNSDPALVYAQEAVAEASLNTWIASHQDFEPYQQEMARRKAAAEARERELSESFIARGID